MRLNVRFALSALLFNFALIAFASLLIGGRAASAAQIQRSAFNGPTGIAICGSHVWVTNASGNSLTELNAVNGERVQVMDGPASEFYEPMGITANGTDLWVANLSGNSVREINCGSGTSVRNISSGSLNAPVAIAVGGAKVWVASQAHQNDSKGNIIPNSSSVNAFSAKAGSLDEAIAGTNANGFNGSSGVSVSGAKVWVTNANGNSVSELDAKTGHVIRVVGQSAGAFNWPMGVASNGAYVWVENLEGNSLTQIDESTGSVLRVVTGDGLDGPDSICFLGNEIWVTNLYGNSVTELNARNGDLIRVINSKSDGFSAPMGITGRGASIWVTNQWSNTVTELVASSGSLERILH